MNIDKWSQRIVAASLGISTILLSISCFVYATNQTGLAQAEDISQLRANADWDNELRGGVGLGIVDGTGFFVVWAQPNKLYKVDLNKASDWYTE